jgi:LPS O-antigen subunit length determinant protein (WzzB/FepE family)
VSKETLKMDVEVQKKLQTDSVAATRSYVSEADEIDLRELAVAIWQGKWLIIGITAIFSIASVFYALSKPDEYKSTVLLAPASSSGGGLSKLASQYGGLASLAGINLGGGSGGENKVAIAMEIIKTWGFQESFIEENNLQVALFAAIGWNRASNKLVINSEIYDETNNKWLRKYNPASGQKAEPSSWELYNKLKNRVSISQDEISGLISLTVEYYSPELAKEWVEKLVKAINANLKNRDRDEATKSIEYLQEKIQETHVTDMQAVFYQLIEEQTKTLMLAEVSEEYVFKTLSSARVSVQKSKPKRALIVVLGAMLGGLFSMMIVLIRYFLAKAK